MSRWRDMLRAKLADSPHAEPSPAAKFDRIDKTHPGEDRRDRDTAARPGQFVNFGNFGSAAGREGAAHDPATLRDDYAERAAIIEHDAGRPRPEAEAEAYRAAVARWLLLNPPPASGAPDCCAHCGVGPRQGRVILPFGVAEHGVIWLHHGCWPPWHRARHITAKAALVSVGIVGP